MRRIVRRGNLDSAGGLMPSDKETDGRRGRRSDRKRVMTGGRHGRLDGRHEDRRRNSAIIADHDRTRPALARIGPHELGRDNRVDPVANDST